MPGPENNCSIPPNSYRIYPNGGQGVSVVFKKDYRKWHKQKVQLNELETAERFFYEKEVWWIAVGQNIRFEQDGKGPKFARPVLVLRKFNKYLFFGIPLSTTSKRGKYYYHFKYKEEIESVAILSQLRSFDSNRLIDKDGIVSDKDYTNIQKKITGIINKLPQK